MSILTTPPSILPLPSDQDSTGRTLGDEEIAALTAVIRSGTLTSTKVEMVKRLETWFAAMLDLPHSHACASGTAALHTAFAAFQLVGKCECIDHQRAFIVGALAKHVEANALRQERFVQEAIALRLFERTGNRLFADWLQIRHKSPRSWLALIVSTESRRCRFNRL